MKKANAKYLYGIVIGSALALGLMMVITTIQYFFIDYLFFFPAISGIVGGFLAGFLGKRSTRKNALAGVLICVSPFILKSLYDFYVVQIQTSRFLLSSILVFYLYGFTISLFISGAISGILGGYVAKNQIKDLSTYLKAIFIGFVFSLGLIIIIDRMNPNFFGTLALTGSILSPLIGGTFTGFILNRGVGRGAVMGFIVAFLTVVGAICSFFMFGIGLDIITVSGFLLTLGVIGGTIGGYLANKLRSH